MLKPIQMVVNSSWWIDDAISLQFIYNHWIFVAIKCCHFARNKIENETTKHGNKNVILWKWSNLRYLKAQKQWVYHLYFRHNSVQSVTKWIHFWLANVFAYVAFNKLHLAKETHTHTHTHTDSNNPTEETKWNKQEKKKLNLKRKHKRHKTKQLELK